MATVLPISFYARICIIRPCIPLMQLRFSNTLPHRIVEKHRKSRLSHNQEEAEKIKEPALDSARDFRYVYPEFLPNPLWHRRDRISENLEHRDMYRRRTQIDIPEFYVGSILAVTTSDEYAPGKQNRFVGLCIDRSGHGLNAVFVLRNIVDGLGVEIIYAMYSPVLLKIEVLKLEKRLDDEMYYLRDCDPIHSTVPFNMEPVTQPAGSTVPVNNIQVKLKPWPWSKRWELHSHLRGIVPLRPEDMPAKRYLRSLHPNNVREWESYDLMKWYRESINDDETAEIMTEVNEKLKGIGEEKARRQREALKTKAQASQPLPQKGIQAHATAQKGN